MDKLDETMLRTLSYSCQGCFPPLCAVIGGIVAQEVLKALTGKFGPLNQWVSHCSIQLLFECVHGNILFFDIDLKPNFIEYPAIHTNYS